MSLPLVYVVCWVRPGTQETKDVSLYSTEAQALAAVQDTVRIDNPKLQVLYSQGCYVGTDGMVVGYLLRKRVEGINDGIANLDEEEYDGFVDSDGGH